MRPSCPSRVRRRLAWMFVAAAAFPVAAAAADLPAGWKVIKDRKGNCQMAVPADWKGTASTASPEDHQALAAIHLLPGKDWAESKAMAERFMVPQEVIEDGPERFWIAYAMRADRNPADAEDDTARKGALETTPKGAVEKAPKGAGGAPAAVKAGAKPAASTTPATAGSSLPPPVKASEVGWYVSVPGPLGPCAAQITFKTDDLAETAREIALSVAAVVPAR